MNQLVIVFSGRKSAGKTTVAESLKKWLDETSKESAQCCGLFSFADALKSFCVDVLNLSFDSIYGSEEQKNAPTQYLWDNIDKYFRWKFSDRTFIDSYGNKYSAKNINPEKLKEHYENEKVKGYKPENLKQGNMSGREVMQLFGTDLIRYNFGNVWAKATINLIEKRKIPVNLITDNRFPNEVDSILNLPFGYIVRLTRSPFQTQDAHDSESMLDHFEWESKEKCYILENSNISIEEQTDQLKNIFDKIITNAMDNGYSNWPINKIIS